VRDVDKKEVPIEVLRHITVQLTDGTSVTVDVTRLLNNGADPIEVEMLLDEKFEELDEFIEAVDFFIDVDKVANSVFPETCLLLKDI